jgi:membrane protease YdiL (CAAX protease family)
MLCIAVGTVISIPALAFRSYANATGFQELTYRISKAPADDVKLLEWGRTLPRVETFNIHRNDGALRLRWEYRGVTPLPLTAEPDARMRQLGYEFQPRNSRTGVAGFAHIFRDPITLAVVLAGMQLAFGGFALIMRRKARRAGNPLPPLFAGNACLAIGCGIVIGLGLLLFGHLYDAALQAVFHSVPSSPWNAMGALSATAAIVLLGFGAIGAPLTEELFFRGHVFARFWGQGYAGLGVIVSALLFAGAHFSDPYNMPAILVFGVVLAYAYQRTGSLLTPITAHLVNNGVALTLLLRS